MAIKVEQVGVVGAGQMGNGIAQVFAAKGFQVTMMDVSEAQLEKGLKTIQTSCDRLVAKEKMTAEQKTQLLSRIKLVSTLR